MANGGEFSLAWLLQPLTVESFLNDIWATTHHHVARGCAGYFDALLRGPSAVDELLEHVRPDPSAVRLVRGGESKQAETYRGADGGLDLGRVRDDFADGYTIVLNGLERYVRAIASLSHGIEVELNFPVRVNGYITPPQSTGFVPHFDPHDVLVLQIQGSKTWQLSDDTVVPHEMLRGEAVDMAGHALSTALRLEAGDVLYLPRGRVHAAETTCEPSLHLTVGMHAPTALTLLTHALHALSLTDDRVHARLPPRHLDDPDVRASLTGLVDEVVDTLAKPSVVAQGLGAMEEVLARRGRCPPVGQFSDAVGIDEHTLVAKIQPLYSRVAAVAGGVALQFAQLSIGAAADHEAALRFLSRSAEPFQVGDLPGLTPAQQTELARTLIATGFLVRVGDGQAATADPH
jgi:hypothetical protein